jgi:hypothetical protein
MTYEKCPSCGTDLGDGRCRACDAENDRLNPPETPEPRMAAIRAEIAETAGGIDATEERTPMPDVAGYAELLARIPEGYTEGPWRHLREDVRSVICTPGREMGFAKASWGNTLYAVSVKLHGSERQCRIDMDLVELAPELADALRTMPATILRYLYAEAGVRARMLGATDAERLAHAAVRQDIRELAERFGVELEG